MQCDRFRGEISTLNGMHQNEVRARIESQKQGDNLEGLLNERTDQLNRCSYDLDNSNMKNERLLEDNTKLFSEIERLKNHIIVLTEQNQRVSDEMLIINDQLTDELEYVLDQDERIKTHLTRKEKIYGTISQNKYYLEKSLSSLDEHLNKSGKTGFSPGRTGFSPSSQSRGRLSPGRTPNK